jgi:hypothetical protein
MFDSLAGCSFEGDIPKFECIPILFGNVIGGVLLFGAVFAVFLFAYGAIRLLMSAGDPKQVSGARGIMTTAIVGFIIVLSAVSIVFFIGFLTNSTACITNLGKITKGC